MYLFLYFEILNNLIDLHLINLKRYKIVYLIVYKCHLLSQIINKMPFNGINYFIICNCIFYINNVNFSIVCSAKKKNKTIFLKPNIYLLL